MRAPLIAAGLYRALNRCRGAGVRGGGAAVSGTALGEPADDLASMGPADRQRSDQPRAQPGAGSLLRTALYDYHVANGAQMAAFNGWAKPLRYSDSPAEEVQHCRSQASLFDASDLPMITLKGRDAVPFIEGLVVADVAGLPPGASTLTLLTNERGGIIDDAVLTRVDLEELLLVVNAGCRAKDLGHLAEHLEKFKAKGGQVQMWVNDGRSLMALQGPQAASVLQGLAGEDLGSFFFGQFRKLIVAGVPCWASRIGYTGEDGFELSMPTEHVQRVAEAIHSDTRVRLGGVEVHDLLGLEAGLCCYGNELSEDITPVEARLAWTVGARRREAFDFLGGHVIQKQLAEGTALRRVGLTWDADCPAEEHAEVLMADGRRVGWITRARFSHCLDKCIAMGYVRTEAAKGGTALRVRVPGGGLADAVVTRMPFLPTHYHKPAAPQPAAPNHRDRLGIITVGGGALNGLSTVGHHHITSAT